MRERIAIGSSWISCPPTSAFPAVGERIVARIRMVVVLPAPFGPRKPNASPRAISRSTPRRASKGLRKAAYRFFSPCTRMAASAKSSLATRSRRPAPEKTRIRAKSFPSRVDVGTPLCQIPMGKRMVVRRARTHISERRIRASVLRVLASNKLCSIATVARENRAHINTAFFAYSPNFELYFLSDPQSLHCRNLVSNPSMAMTIFNSSQNWDAPGRGIQLFGRGHRTQGRQAVRAENAYGSRFPAFRRWLEGTHPAERRQAALLRSYALFRFLPTRVKILDEAEFGSAVFIIAAVRRHAEVAGGRSRAELSWQ